MRPRATRRVVGLIVCVVLEAPRVSADPDGVPPQVAYGYGEEETPRSAALSGALRALGSSTSTVYLNPAMMVRERVYHLGALAQFMPEGERSRFGAVATDSVTSRLAGGFSISAGSSEPRRSFLDVRLSLAYPLGDRIFAGLGGRYLSASQDGLGVLGDSLASGGLKEQGGERDDLVDEATFDAGVGVRLADGLFLGASGQNLTRPGHGLLPMLAGAGLGYATKSFSAEVDALIDLDSWGRRTTRVMGGLELLLGDHVPLRGGYRYDEGAGSHALSFGTGYIESQFSLEAAVRRTVSGPGTTTLVLGLTYFLEATGYTRAPEAL